MPSVLGVKREALTAGDGEVFDGTNGRNCTKPLKS